jgi:hypothetical protein
MGVFVSLKEKNTLLNIKLNESANKPMEYIATQPAVSAVAEASNAPLSKKELNNSTREYNKKHRDRNHI